MSCLFSLGRIALRYAVMSMLLVAVAATAAGCQLFGAIVEQTQGDDPIKAIYVPAKVPMVVLVENYDGSSAIESENLTGYIEGEITQNKIAPLVGSDRIAVLKDADPTAFHNMSIKAIAQAVGAKQVLCVDKVDAEYDQPQASDMAQGSLSANARIVSADTGDSVWPAGAEAGKRFSVEIPFTPLNQASQSELRSRLTHALAVQIVNTFHDYQRTPEDVDSSQRP
jgi:hypothetical protein